MPCSMPDACVPLEDAIGLLATAAAYDMRLGGKEDGAVETPMLWQYQVVRMHVLPPTASRWADGAAGRGYTPIVLELDHERLGQPYRVEEELNRLPPSDKHALGPVPILVRLQYMNMCHSFNGAAAMALVHYARCHGVQWSIGGARVREVGWRWGNAPEGGTALTVCQVGTSRVKHQALGHHVVWAMTEEDEEYVLDLSIAQFGEAHSVPARTEAVPASAGRTASRTLASRAACGIAPTLFARSSSQDAASVRHVRLVRGQRAVEAALRLVDDAGEAKEAGYPVCDHVMPPPLFRAARPAGSPPAPDDDLVEEGVLASLRKFLRALARR
jgi:hypothetical protein